MFLHVGLDCREDHLLGHSAAEHAERLHRCSSLIHHWSFDFHLSLCPPGAAPTFPLDASHFLKSLLQVISTALHSKALSSRICLHLICVASDDSKPDCNFLGIFCCCSESRNWKTSLNAIGLSLQWIFIVEWYWIFLMQVGVSLVLSFMVVWDLPRIAGGVSSLETSRLSAVYAEVAPSVSIFGELFGRALQAQVSVFMCSKLLTLRLLRQFLCITAAGQRRAYPPQQWGYQWRNQNHFL